VVLRTIDDGAAEFVTNRGVSVIAICAVDTIAISLRSGVDSGNAQI